MTRKEAIKVLKDSMAGRMVLYKDSVEATQMAIDALEKLEAVSVEKEKVVQAPTIVNEEGFKTTGIDKMKYKVTCEGGEK